MSQLEIEVEPIAAASMGQVHRARIKKTGQEIVLKIQYPGVEEAIDGDLKVLRRFLSMAELLPNLPNLDEVFDEIRSMLRQELDYQHEFKMLTKFRAVVADNPHFVVPEPIQEFSAKRVLAMSFEPGVTVDSKEVAALSQERRNALAKIFLQYYFRELFELRTVQTDPHFGNYRIRIGSKSDQIVLYDFGAVREFSQSFVDIYRDFIAAIANANFKDFVKATRALGLLQVGDDPSLEKDFFDLTSMVLEPFSANGADDYSWDNDLPKRVTKKGAALALKHKLRSPPKELVFLDRKIAGVFTFLSVLKAKLNGRAILDEYLK